MKEDLLGFKEFVQKKFPNSNSDNLKKLEECFIFGVEWERHRFKREFEKSLSPKQRKRIENGMGFLPSYMLEEDGSVKEGEWF